MAARRALLGLSVLVGLLVLAHAAWSGPQLTPRIGEILSAKIAAHAFDGALPAGWVIEDVAIAPDHIDLRAVDAEKHAHGVTLRPSGSAQGPGDGHGRSFVFVIDADGALLDDAGKRGLLTLAAGVDAAIPAEDARRTAPRRMLPRWLILGCPRWLILGCVFYGVAIAAAFVSAWRSRQHLRSREAIVPAMLTLVAFGVRLFARAGVGDIRQVLEAGIGEGNRARAGWSALLRLLFVLFPARYETIWLVHRVVGALAVPLLYAALRQRFPQRQVAAAGAAALAVLPLAARFSASDTPYVPLCTAFLAAVVALTRFRQSGSRGALAVGLVLITAAMHLRPDGPWLIVPLLILTVSVPCVPAGRAVSPATLVGGALFVTANVVPALWALAGHNHFGDGSLRAYAMDTFILVGTVYGSPWADLTMSPWPLSLLVLGGVAIAATSGRVGIGWLTATLVAMPLKFSAIDQYANARYHLPSVYLACGLAGLSVAYVVERVGRRLPVQVDPVLFAVMLVFVAVIPRLDLLRRLWTPQAEFDFYRAGLARLDPACDIVTLADTPDAGFVPFSDPAAQVPVDVAAFLRNPSAAPSSCVVYYRAATCRSADAAGPSTGTAFDENPSCREIERRATLRPIVETSLPARPFRGERYSVDPIPVGFYRIVDLAGDH